MTSYTRKQGDKRRYLRPRHRPPDILRKGHSHADRRELVEENEREIIERQLDELEEEQDDNFHYY